MGIYGQMVEEEEGIIDQEAHFRNWKKSISAKIWNNYFFNK